MRFSEGSASSNKARGISAAAIFPYSIFIFLCSIAGPSPARCGSQIRAPNSRLRICRLSPEAQWRCGHGMLRDL
ncbi:hypothetical protein D3C73_1558960 [compost metagenome]